MTWFKVDDGFWRGKKVRRLGVDRLPAVGLWTLAGDWAADNVDTNVADGFVPWEVIDGWDTRRRYARRLIDVGLWEEIEIDGEPGIVFHDWAEYQPSAERVRAERAAAAERQRKWRKSRRTSGDSHAVTDRTTNGETNSSSHSTPTRPDPTRPEGRGRGGGGDDRAAIRACALCTADGYRFEPGRRIPMTPYLRCDHQPLNRAIPA